MNGLDLHTVLIFTANSGALSYVFKQRPAAENVYRSILSAKSEHIKGSDRTTTISWRDDFGKDAMFDVGEIRGCQLTRIGDDLAGAAELTTMQTLANARFQKRMQSDPEMRLVAVQQGGIIGGGMRN